jgi:hypothetical protein
MMTEYLTSTALHYCVDRRRFRLTQRERRIAAAGTAPLVVLASFAVLVAVAANSEAAILFLWRGAPLWIGIGAFSGLGWLYAGRALVGCAIMFSRLILILITMVIGLLAFYDPSCSDGEFSHDDCSPRVRTSVVFGLMSGAVLGAPLISSLMVFRSSDNSSPADMTA